ncbi:hypothetical protein AVEN_72672-1 [Araneus ventricosus]|uniref:Uncharacterized protein n=1 Tax=Araneus ventricosus TaxID=182803 RepID=A0A4Y2DBZ0_ARAVE|nr:hypothetical protein AVEN_72672-1 [Araneus ventricosus]
MTPRVLPFVPQASYFEGLMTSVRCCPFRVEVFTSYSNCRLHTKKFFLDLESLHKLLPEVETDEDSDFDNEYLGNVSEEKFSNHENFSKHDTESDEDYIHCFFTYQ